MTFLNPAILFALFAASIPILIHLLNLRKLKKIEFSTLAFLKELQKNKIRKIKLKQWLLLALRTLIIIFIVLAFARPTLKGVAIGGTTSAAKTTAVFVLDDSFSMSVIQGEGTYFNQAKKAVQELLAHLEQGDEAAIILTSDLSSEPLAVTNNLQELSKKVNELKISYISGTVHEALLKAAAVISQSKNFNKEIYLLSDFQKSSLSNSDSFPDLSELLNDKVRLYKISFSGKEIYNLGIDDIKINTLIFEKDKPVSFSVTVTNYSKQDVRNAVVSLFAGGKRSAQQSVDLKQGESNILNFETNINASGFVEVYAEIEDDQVLYDNRRYIDVFIPKQLPVIIFAGESGGSRFVELSLATGEEENRIKITKKKLNQITAVNPAQYEAVIIAGTESSADLSRIKEYVKNGGGLMIMPGEKSSLQSFQEVCSTFDIPLPAAMADAGGLAFSQVDFNHPLFQNLFEKKEKQKIESPGIYRYLKVNTGGRGKNIITMPDNSALLSEFKFGTGKILVLSVAPVLSWSDLPLKGIFAPLMNKSIFYLASKDRAANSIYAGESIKLRATVDGFPQVKLIKPEGIEEIINLTDQNPIYSKTSEAGFYRFFAEGNPINLVSVNHLPKESVMNYLTESEFEEYLKKINFRGKLISIEKDEKISEAVMNARFGSELWKYALLAALIFALLEMIVSKSAKKDIIQVK